MSWMIDADEILKELTCDFTGKQFHGNRKVTIGECRRIIENAHTITQPNEPTYPCDLCVYNPPSSLDGKPCTFCPATGRPPEGEEEI